MFKQKGEYEKMTRHKNLLILFSASDKKYKVF